jgi:bifunctional UDP-N-acetylglucosamine pyrophosphorylase/glucosamine-1-phosphate N-acetyltransferase
MKIAAVILAAGSGTRLNAGQPSEKPKVLYEILGKPMLAYTMELLNSLNIPEKVMVVGYRAELVEGLFKGSAKFALQEERLGTAHAAKIGEKQVGKDFTHLLIIQGDDSAFYKKETIERFISCSRDYKISFTTVKLEDPGAFGRVIRNENGEVSAIVEKEATTEEQKHINEINAATYLVERRWFNENYKKLKPSKVGKGEIIMPDLIKAAFEENVKVLGFEVPSEEWVGVNTPDELESANILMKEKLDGG